ncbi:MAG: peptidoglycan-binding protein, partial [Clostridia bacterium]|nr:peptidoglycan-binding protein [Clostridia bacterium]
MPVYIPENIVVHLGAPDDSSAQNVTVPFVDYIKNTASSEIYPTWPESALRANIYAQISFALNRIYTEYYRSRGYNFDITNSTAFDQSFVYGRDVFENVGQIVDDVFDEYIRRQGNIEPLFAQYCDGVRVTCDGLSQWGSVSLAESGYTPYEILTNYYGNDIDIVRDTPIRPFDESYPTVPLELGSSGNDVRTLQLRLNRVSNNYPSIPKIYPVNGVFGVSTEDAVIRFQELFDLAPDGRVGKATWYQLLRIYGGVKRLSELQSEGITPEEIELQYPESLQVGSSGEYVRIIQYIINVIAQNNPAIPAVSEDGIFGEATRNAVIAFQR